MANRRKSMRRIRQVLRLAWEVGLKQRPIARTIRIALRTERRKAVTGRFRREENKVPLNSEKPG